MRVKTGIQILVFVAIACLCVPGAFAKAYVGAAAGQGTTEFDPGVGENFSASDTSYKMFGGYRVIKWFAVEGDYRNLGSQTDTFGTESVTLDTKSLDIFAVGVVPIGNSFEVFGKAGYSMWDAEISASTGGSVSDDGNDMAYGVGAAYNFGRVGVRLEYELFDLPEVDTVSMASLGVDFRF
jgi:OOP family OmpA-OmpF porin